MYTKSQSYISTRWLGFAPTMGVSRGPVHACQDSESWAWSGVGGMASMIGSSPACIQWELDSLVLGCWIMWPQRFSGVPVHEQKLRVTGAVVGGWHGHYSSATATHTKNQSHRHGWVQFHAHAENQSHWHSWGWVEQPLQISGRPAHVLLWQVS